MFSLNNNSVSFKMLCLLTIAICFGAVKIGWGEQASMEEARQVAQNWLTYLIFQKGEWGKNPSPELMEGQKILRHDTLLGYYFPVAPSGYIGVPIIKELPPIKAYSEEYRINIENEVGFPALLKEELLSRIRLYIKEYGSLDAVQPATGDILLARAHREEWDKFLKTQKDFQYDVIGGKLAPLTQAGPLLTTSWHQHAPYNNYCPIGHNNERCIAGCMAIATAQVMNYWNWPTWGKGSFSYWWDGDECDVPTDFGADTLSVSFQNSYYWDNMPDSCDGGCSSLDSMSLGELCYEVGVALRMDYGTCASSASFSRALTILPDYFYYKSSLQAAYRVDYSADDWFAVIQAEINNGRPMLYYITGHAIVCDGWRDTGGQSQYHMNYGWGGGHNSWYTIDELFCDAEPNDICPTDNQHLIRYIEPKYKTLLRTEVYDGNGGPLTYEDSPCLITYNVDVPQYQTLTIEPGVDIYYETGYFLTAYGTLNINANVYSPVKLFMESTPHWGMKLQTNLRLKNGEYIRPLSN